MSNSVTFKDMINENS